MSGIKNILKCVGFQWDKGNVQKSWNKHKVSPAECEQVFFNSPLLILDDAEHSKKEERFFALGKTDSQRLLFVSLTLRENLMRVISARDMHRKERKRYLS
ncbi:hypothetical protein MNBD_BACTEROID05-1098 [hydrothermal vent metagenome]|uniref:BrnT family toxin n=1 Tax=hydrothermal vent metagenome TaxID=652676 RepID=A0A3B0TDX6_9ZZZZ